MHDGGGESPHNPYAPPHAEAPASTAGGVEDEEFRPFRTIWLRPRSTIRRIVETDPDLHVLPIVCVAGITETLGRASERNSGDDLPLAGILAVAVVLGPIGGLLGFWILTHLVRWTGRWIGGIAPRAHLRAAIAWASLPTAAFLPLWIPPLLLFGIELFTEQTPRMESDPTLLGLFLVFAVMELATGIYSLVLLCRLVAEVQGFRSAWRGLANVLLAGIVIVVPIAVLVAVVLLATRG